MKKSLLFSVLFTGLIFWAGFSFGQCTPNPWVTDPEGNGEMVPDTLYGIETVPMDLTLTIIGPDTASAGGYGHINLDSIIIKSIQNKPGWLSYACDNPNCRYVASALQCARVTGTPPAASADTIYLNVMVDAWIHIGIIPVQAATNTNGGTIVLIIHPAIWGTTDYKNTNFEVIQNQPNPFVDKTKIGCFTKNTETVNLSVVDILGNTIYSEQMSATSGENFFRFDGSQLNSGMYFYTITDSQNHKVSRKMVKAN
jgi:hypothetical protein